MQNYRNGVEYANWEIGSDVMTITESRRLAEIRVDNMKWTALRPDAESWNETFLLSIIDRQNEELRRVKKEIAR